jgi:cation diffusion facilitator family transporter
MAKESEGRRKLHAASFSIGVNLFLIFLKSTVAFITGSLAILAELAHSIFDTLASVLAYLGIMKASEPADTWHQYGHEKFENLSSFAQTVLIVITSVLIIYEAIGRILFPRKIEATELGILIMVATIGIDYFISKYLHKASRDYGSCALEADAYHFTTDLWGALAVIAGLGFVMIGFPVFDSIAAIFVAVLMLRISYRLAKKSINVLVDISPSISVMEKISSVISSTPGVKGFHKLKARHAGSKLLIETHVKVAPQISVRKGHYIGHSVKRRLMKDFPEIKEVTVHVEPELPDKRNSAKKQNPKA